MLSFWRFVWHTSGKRESGRTDGQAGGERGENDGETGSFAPWRLLVQQNGPLLPVVTRAKRFAAAYREPGKGAGDGTYTRFSKQEPAKRPIPGILGFDNNRLKTTKNMDFVKNPCFSGGLEPTFGWQISNRVIEQVQYR
jgi:hypothetical protein